MGGYKRPRRPRPLRTERVFRTPQAGAGGRHIGAGRAAWHGGPRGWGGLFVKDAPTGAIGGKG